MNPTAIGYLAIGLIFVLSFCIDLFQRQRRNNAWNNIATNLGLSFESGSYPFSTPEISGRYRDHSVSIENFSVRSGRSSVRYTRISMALNASLSLVLKISQEGIGSQVEKLFGAQDIHVGDEEFDRRFLIQGNPVDLALRVLSSSALRATLLALPNLHLTLEGAYLRHQERGVILEPDHVRSLLDLLVDLAIEAERTETAPFSNR